MFLGANAINLLIEQGVLEGRTNSYGLMTPPIKVNRIDWSESQSSKLWKLSSRFGHFQLCPVNDSSEMGYRMAVVVDI